MEWIKAVLSKAIGDKQFFGAVTIRIEAGKPVHIDLSRGIKPPK